MPIGPKITGVTVPTEGNIPFPNNHAPATRGYPDEHGPQIPETPLPYRPRLYPFEIWTPAAGGDGITPQQNSNVIMSTQGAYWRSLLVDNFSNQWLRVGQERASFIPPYVIGKVVPLRGVAQLQFTWQAPPGLTQSAAQASPPIVGAVVIASENEWPPTNGVVGSAPGVGIKGTETTMVQVTVTNAATLLLAANPRRIRATIRNLSTSVAFYYGTSAVTTSTGIGLGPGTAPGFGDIYTTTDRVDAIYGITASSTAVAGIEEVS